MREMIDELSLGARQLAELAGRKGDVIPILKEHPELIGSLDEYIKWRDAENVAIKTEQETFNTGHSLSVIAKKFRK